MNSSPLKPASPLKFGIIGAWHTHTPGLVRQIITHPEEFSLLGVYDPEPDVVAARNREWSPQIPDLQWCDSEEAVLNLPLDAVIIDGRISANLDVALRVVERGLPILLEKPAGVDLEKFELLHRRAAEKKVHVQLLYLFRYMSAMVEMRKRADAYGQIHMFRGRLPKDFTLYDSFVEELGGYPGGIFYEMAGHLVDQMVALLGPPRKVHPFLGHHNVAKPGSFIDNGVAVFEFDHAFGIIEVPALETAPDYRRIEVFGTAGAAVIPHLGSGHLANNPYQPIEVFRTGDAGWERLNLNAAVLQIADLREFAAVVHGKKSPEFTPAHDLAVHKALLQASGMHPL